MDSNSTKPIDDSPSGLNEQAENAEAIAIQPESELLKELQKKCETNVRFDPAKEMENKDNTDNNDDSVVVCAETSPVIESSALQPSTSAATQETVQNIELKATEEKSEEEPMDIDEILNSLTDTTEIEKEAEDDVVLLSDGESETEQKNAVEVDDIALPESSENINEKSELQSEVMPIVADETTKPSQHQSSEVEQNKTDINVSAKSPSPVKDDIVAVAGESSNEQKSDVVELIDEENKDVELNDLQEHPTNESVNIMDLLRENEDLFGMVYDVDGSETGTEKALDDQIVVGEADEKDQSEDQNENKEETSDILPAGKENGTECLNTALPEEMAKLDEKSLLREESTENESKGDALEIGNLLERADVAMQDEMNRLPEEDEKNLSCEEFIGNEDVALEDADMSLEESIVPHRECLNNGCAKQSNIFVEAPEFVVNYFHLSKRPKELYVCEQCYDTVVESYGELCAALEDKQPLFLKTPKYNDLVEIIDSSDEEDNNPKSNEDTEKGSFDDDTLALIENELEAVIRETLQKVDIDQQMNWNRQILKEKIDKNAKNCVDLMKEMKILHSRIDKLHTKTYNFRQNFLEEVQSLDLTTQKPTQICNETYPPTGELQYADIEYNTLYYTFRSKLISRWLPCKVVDKTEVDGQTEYVVRFCREKKESVTKRTVHRKHLAYGRSPDYRLNIGTRVIARFNDTDSSSAETPKADQLKNNFYPGVIAEPLSLYTSWRYLVFFDDGWVQYVNHENIRVVCEASDNVWELIEEPGAKTFIEGYVKELKKKRPIVQVKRGQRIQTESGGKWHNAIVNNVDGSLVQVFFEDNKRYEWIYRGSTRLLPLYKKLKHVTPSANRNEATIEYIVIDDDKEPERSIEPPVEENVQTPPPAPTTTSTPKAAPIQRTFASQAQRDTPQQKQREQKRAVAKKSTKTLQPKPAIQHMNNSTIYVDEDKPKGKVVYYTAKKHIDVKRYIHHECQPSCLVKVQHNLSTYSPLSKPLLSGFERQICKTRFNKKFVVYRAPCGRRLRDMTDMHNYLRMTDCQLNVDNFTFDPLIHCLAEYVIESYVMKKTDLSGGIEKMPVQLINCYDSTTPPACTYSAKRIPTEGVNLTTDPEFLCGCDCTDDCLDKTKCACWKLTLQGAKYGNPDTPIENVGYEYKRLNEAVPTGIYECNAQCKCKSNCLNRVVQHPLQLKLQVFKTVNRGWGLRCLNDVPKGSFICCYAGNLLTETSANEAGEDLGDEYFAELDYIEVVENMKEGYEPEVVNEDVESSGTDEDFDIEKECARNDDSDDEFIAKRYTASEDLENRRYSTRNSVDTRKKVQSKDAEKRKGRSSFSDEEGDGVRQVKNIMASSTMPLNDEQDEDRDKSFRSLFGKNEAVYIMDAKKAGNIGRYFNHSCGPNLFVQNVFVDTHDLRFPWVAFFASTHIRAGTELTWNYNYEVGSVPGKVLICQCGDEKCRGRIL